MSAELDFAVLLGLAAAAVALAAAFSVHTRNRQRRLVSERDAHIERLEADVQALRRNLHIDLVTGLGNATLLEDDWVRLSAVNRRRPDPFTLVVYLVADATEPDQPLDAPALRAIAETLFETTRTEDHLYKIDGQAFVALLVGCTAAGAVAFVERGRRALTAASVGEGKARRYLTVAAGIAEWDEEMGTLAALLRTAEASALADSTLADATRRHFGHADYVA